MGLIGAIWGVGGILLLLGFAVFKVSPPAIELLSLQLQWYHWIFLILNTSLVLYYKGHRALQKAFIPRVAARARFLSDNPTLHRTILAPLFCMGYFYIARRKQIVTIALTCFMIGVIMLVRLLDQPWRGIVDLGVGSALAWAFISLIFYTMKAFSAEGLNHSIQLPD